MLNFENIEKITRKLFLNYSALKVLGAIIGRLLLSPIKKAIYFTSSLALQSAEINAPRNDTPSSTVRHCRMLLNLDDEVNCVLFRSY